MSKDRELALLPCPFCGGSASFEARPRPSGSEWVVRCDRRFLPNADDVLCAVNMRTHSRIRREEAAQLWNTRYDAGRFQWVAVSERLPDERGDYLVRNQQGSCEVGYFAPDSYREFQSQGGGSIYDAFAWMQIPPYTPEDK